MTKIFVDSDAEGVRQNLNLFMNSVNLSGKRTGGRYERNRRLFN